MSFDDIREFLRNIFKFGTTRHGYKMAACSEVDDGDLIDLGTGLCIISRGSGSSLSGTLESTFEEQEHLLDVCPPKLEQKLSLTHQQRRDGVSGEVVAVDGSSGDVLVTLGHDKVVPIAKRIDVVSSDTIKRVKDITKNLEPVIRSDKINGSKISSRNKEYENKISQFSNEDYVDGVLQSDDDSLELENESFETQEINNAFNFLAELDDCEEDEEDEEEEEEEDAGNRMNESISSDGPLMDEELESMSGSNIFTDFQTINQKLDLNKTDEDIAPIHRSHSTNYFDYIQTGYKLSPKINRAKTLPVNSRIKFSLDFHHKEKSNASLSDDKKSSDEIHQLNGNKSPIRSTPKLDRKSWSEEDGFRSVTSSASRVARSFSLEIEPDTNQSSHSDPANSNAGSTTVANSLRMEPEELITASSASPSTSASSPSQSSSSSSSSSVSSEVDWSWVDEVESRSRSVNNKLGTGVVGVVAGRWVAEEEEEAAPTNGRVERMRPAGNPARTSTDSTVMSGLPVAKSSPVPGLPSPTGSPLGSLRSSGSPVVTRTQNGEVSISREAVDNRENGALAATSWVRASMRRLRHLRLPETEISGNRSRGHGRVDANDDDADADLPSATTASSSFSTANSLPDIALIAPEILAAHTNGTSANTLRPASAPTPRATLTANPTTPARGRLPGGRSRGRSHGSGRGSIRSRNTNTDTSCSSSSANSTVTSPNSTPTATPQHPSSPRRICDRQRGADRDDERGEDDDEDENPLGRWPHALSPALACLGCTLGLFNISRFAILSIQFGANFIVQFLVLSLVLGIPLFTLHVCLGQRLAAGAVDMWKISPLFQGVGIALLTAHAFIGIYSIVGISWMFVYFRDSFITKQERYQWAEPSLLYRDDTRSMHNGTPYKLQETVPDYFSGAVLQRYHLNEPESGVVTLKFQVAFNLAVVWMIVFVSLSKGLRSYGKVVYVFTLLPVFGTLVLCAKLLGLTPTGSIHQLFPETVWSEFFINGKSWMAASSEVFLTWGLFGAAAMQIAAHNKHKHLLQRDTSLVVVLTFVVLLLSAFLANTCVQILRHHRYVYTTSSFEEISSYSFMHSVNQQVHRGQVTTPERFMNHASFLAGQRVVRPGADLNAESGYQVLRLATELVPATLAILGSEQVSPFWAVLFYFILILFGIAQQLAIWHCVITGIMAIDAKMMKLWETTITFFSCACGYVLGLPMATEFGIYVVYYLDYTVGGAWWIMVLYLVEVGAVFAVRGRPHTGEAVVAELFPPTGRCLRHWAGPLLSFTWNVVLPVALMVLSIMIFKSSGFRELYTYRRTSRDYWAIWARQLGAAIQLIPILMIPVVAIIQTCRYLNSGPPDIFDRIQLLYRPSLEPDDQTDPQTQITSEAATSIHGNGVLPSTTDVPFEDPPPKYTPPPSYTTATGARIAKMLRQSFRRSVRRIANVLGESSNPRSRPALQPPPPDYAAVLVEMNQGIPTRDISIIVTDVGGDVTDTGLTRSGGTFDRRRPNTIDRTMRIGGGNERQRQQNGERSISHYSTMDRSRERRAQTNNGSSNLTAADVANLLRSSIRRGANSRNQQSSLRSFATAAGPTAAVSIENLVEAAAPIGQDSLVLPKDESLVSVNDFNDDDKKTADQTDNTTTVI